MCLRCQEIILLPLEAIAPLGFTDAMHRTRGKLAAARRRAWRRSSARTQSGRASGTEPDEVAWVLHIATICELCFESSWIALDSTVDIDCADCAWLFRLAATAVPMVRRAPAAIASCFFIAATPWALKWLSRSRLCLNERKLLSESDKCNTCNCRLLKMEAALCQGVSRKKSTGNGRDRDQFGTHDNFLPAKK